MYSEESNPDHLPDANVQRFINYTSLPNTVVTKFQLEEGTRLNMIATIT
jgi:hypothetical protein